MVDVFSLCHIVVVYRLPIGYPHERVHDTAKHGHYVCYEGSRVEGIVHNLYIIAFKEIFW